ncbi:MAG: hypothetical protein D6786_04330 [Gammaproteobacteria bacterium]|nr:MAG: hypothetical protein D6786_04330 [Gammaproteobacteria bacterium]
MNHSAQTYGGLPGGDGRRALMVGGLLLILAGMLFGDVFAVFILHPNAARIIGSLTAAAGAVASGDADAAAGAIAVMGGLLENRGTKVDAHVHALVLGYLAVILALLQPFVAWSRETRMWLARWFLAAACIMPPSIFAIHYVGLAYSPFPDIGWASLFADASGLVIILVTLAELAGLLAGLTGPRRAQVTATLTLPRLPESRTLLFFGTLMLLAGFVYGMIHAGFLTQEYEARELKRIEEIVTFPARGKEDAARAALTDYAMLQGERGTRIAAHAHINEFGLLALLLAFLQPYVFLRPCWRRRWVKVLVAGALILPLAVASEMRFGLVAGGVADLAGLMVIVAVSAMLFGVLRESGRHDAAGGEG